MERPVLPDGACAHLAWVRFFGPARLVVTRSEDWVRGTAVGEVLANCEVRFGRDLTEILSSCAIWVNGEPASRSTKVESGDEVAVLSSVSGGS
jgi:molybdopterin converting factor small subunit